MRKELAAICAVIALSVAAAAQEDARPGTLLSPALESHCRQLVAGPAATALADVCRFALATERMFPDFVCDQTTNRYESANGAFSRKRPSSVLTATVTYAHGGEEYSGVKVDGQPIATGMLTAGGLTSTGEFATMLHNLFDPESNTHFFLAKPATLDSEPALQFTFQVPAEHSKWMIAAGGAGETVSYHGDLWISSATGRLRRLEQDADVSTGFPYSSHFVLDYGEVALGERGRFTLPVGYVETACRRGSAKECLRNETIFENCRKFTAKATIVP